MHKYILTKWNGTIANAIMNMGPTYDSFLVVMWGVMSYGYFAHYVKCYDLPSCSSQIDGHWTCLAPSLSTSTLLSSTNTISTSTSTTCTTLLGCHLIPSIAGWFLGSNVSQSYHWPFLRSSVSRSYNWWLLGSKVSQSNNDWLQGSKVPQSYHC